MKNIFLTGPVQIGKSTIIQKIIEEIAEPVGGFLTKKINLGEENKVNIISLLNINENQTFAKFLPSNKHFNIKVYNEVLNDFGSNILKESLQKKHIIIMDELGFIEKDALIFQKSVHTVLDNNNLVLGVIKPKDNKFLNSIRARKDVEIIEVTIENRNAIAKDIIEKLKFYSSI